MYRVFCDDRCMFLIKPDEKFDVNPNIQILEMHSFALVTSGINDWLHGKIVKDIVISSNLNPAELFSSLSLPVKRVEAAGGAVFNHEKKLLFIYRNNFWDLPKGHLEHSETHQIAALREVEEETGLSNLEIISTLPETWHCYRMNSVWYMKHTCWYEMLIEFEQNLVPQTSEGITKIEWINSTGVKVILNNCYRSLHDVLGSDLIRLGKT